MVVQTLDRDAGHLGAVGLFIGADNVERYFPRHVVHIELELDHLRIVCPLEPDFWQEYPEIHDLRLSSWLESKRNSGKLATQPAAVAMIPSGENSFRLQIVNEPVAIDKQAVPRSERMTISPAPAGTAGSGQAAESKPLTPSESVPYASQIASPLALLDRRKRDLGHFPERRSR